jgi:hypothetical protein
MNPSRTECASEFDNLKQTVIKYYLEEYFGIDVQIKVLDFEFWILPIWLDSPTFSPTFCYKI